MIVKFFKIRYIYILICLLIILFCVSTTSYLFYKIGCEDDYISTLSWIVASKKIVVDPGHGGLFPGKVGEGDIVEKDINLKIAQHLTNILSEAGAMVIMTRNTDTDLLGGNISGSFLQKQRRDLKARVDIAKKYKADFFISIHCNSIPSPRWYGAQTFYDPHNNESEILAKTIQNEIIKQLKNTKRKALIRKNTFLFDNLEIPTVIIECGFLSNPKEAKLLSQNEYQYRLAYAIYSGIVKFLSDK